MSFDLVIRGGTLITAADSFQADLGISGERIAAIGTGLHGARTIDARGKLVIPGGVDPHVHLQMPAGVTSSSDDWRTGTRAAAFGGTTTVIDFVEPVPGDGLHTAYEKRRAEAEGQAVIDYGLHMTLNQPALEHLDEVPQVHAAGLTSFKTYTTYEGFALTDAEFLRVMQVVAHTGGVILTHCENDAIIQHHTRQWRETAPAVPASHPRSRPDSAEAEAIQRVLALAESAAVPVYIVHVSTARGVQAITHARGRGQRVFGETCPQYLYLSADCYHEPDFDGARFVCSPPLRDHYHLLRLRGALSSGELHSVGTDHCPFNFAGQKDLGRTDFTQIPGGLPGIEARLALVYALAAQDESFSLNRWVELCCTAPARIFGLYPRKGTLIPGADADLVIFDPQHTMTITHDLLHENVDYTPYVGITVPGWPETTISRGTILVHHGEFVGPPGHGHYLTRGKGGWL